MVVEAVDGDRDSRVRIRPRLPPEFGNATDQHVIETMTYLQSLPTEDWKSIIDMTLPLHPPTASPTPIAPSTCNVPALSSTTISSPGEPVRSPLLRSMFLSPVSEHEAHMALMIRTSTPFFFESHVPLIIGHIPISDLVSVVIDYCIPWSLISKELIHLVGVCGPDVAMTSCIMTAYEMMQQRHVAPFHLHGSAALQRHASQMGLVAWYWLRTGLWRAPDDLGFNYKSELEAARELRLSLLPVQLCGDEDWRAMSYSEPRKPSDADATQVLHHMMAFGSRVLPTLVATKKIDLERIQLDTYGALPDASQHPGSEQQKRISWNYVSTCASEWSHVPNPYTDVMLDMLRQPPADRQHLGVLREGGRNSLCCRQDLFLRAAARGSDNNHFMDAAIICLRRLQGMERGLVSNGYRSMVVAFVALAHLRCRREDSRWRYATTIARRAATMAVDRATQLPVS
jgi:hypothetical protein